MPVEITVKVKANMQFKKIFEVAEVCVVHSSHYRPLIVSLLRNALARIQVRFSINGMTGQVS